MKKKTENEELADIAMQIMDDGNRDALIKYFEEYDEKGFNRDEKFFAFAFTLGKEAGERGLDKIEDGDEWKLDDED